MANAVAKAERALADAKEVFEKAKPEEKDKAEATVEKAQQHFDQLSAEVKKGQIKVENAKSTVSDAQSVITRQEIAVDNATQKVSSASKALASAQQAEEAALAEEVQAKDEVEKASTAVSNAKAAEQRLIDSYQVLNQQVEKGIDTIIGDMAVQDTTGAAAMLSDLINSGSAMAAALLATVLENNIGSDTSSGLPHSAKLQLINQAAERDAISKQSESTEKAVMKSEVSQDVAQLFIGIVAAFSVFGKSQFNEVAAITPGLVSKLSDMEKGSSNNEEGVSDVSNSAQDEAAVNAGTIKANIKSTLAGVKNVLDSAAALIQSGDGLSDIAASKTHRGVINKV